MAFFSRTKEATEPAPADDVSLDALRRSPRAPRKGRAAGAEFDAAPPLDPNDAAKTRARRRLIGAIALGLAAIVFVPMLFDRSQGPVADDISVQIPDRNAPFEGRRGVPEPDRGPLRSSGALPTGPSVATATPPAPTVTTPEPAPTPAAMTPVEQPVPESEAKPVEKPAAKTADKTAEKVLEKVAPAVKPVDKPIEKDDPRALAALEGKSASETADASSGKSFAVQIAAFSSPDRARGLRDQLNNNGLKAYIESLATAQGPRTRVRLGPFASRESADKAKQKLKTMKLDGSVVAL